MSEVEGVQSNVSYCLFAKTFACQSILRKSRPMKEENRCLLWWKEGAIFCPQTNNSEKVEYPGEVSDFATFFQPPFASPGSRNKPRLSGYHNNTGFSRGSWSCLSFRFVRILLPHTFSPKQRLKTLTNFSLFFRNHHSVTMCLIGCEITPSRKPSAKGHGELSSWQFMSPRENK